MRVCETASPPTYYFPPDSIDRSLLRCSPGGTTFCEWKGTATYWNVLPPGGLPPGGQPSDALQRVAWSYEAPTPAFGAIAGWLAFYARPPLECWVGEERVQPQEGQFYGGWVTANIVGPFKGGPGTSGW
ncbi:simple sugar transport system permease [Chlorella sorokiniana]|uniref:Simple sugar transport system permease n=1 Tax=Chlorella sorokiniana TaxID=3076 RepID=A0A2P6TU10_CHLSO|nr:simple sugar transport system permease [Chlorella sorokiniana]|eukprot:PRW57562.1 simple sugar transport system permease [Chlorella sorokiniana]